MKDVHDRHDANDSRPLDLAFHDEHATSADDAVKAEGLGRALRAMRHARAARRRRRFAGFVLLVLGAGWLAWPRPLPRPLQAPSPTDLLAQDEPAPDVEEFDDSDPAHEPASFEAAPTEPSPDRPSPRSPARSTRPTVHLVEAGLAGRLAPPARPRPAIVMLDDEALFAVLDEARLPAILRRIEGPTPSVELRLLAADR